MKTQHYLLRSAAFSLIWLVTNAGCGTTVKPDLRYLNSACPINFGVLEEYKDVQAKIVNTGGSWNLIQRVPTTKLLGVPCDLPPILQEDGLLISFSGRRLVNRDVNFKTGNLIRIDSYTAYR
jgi:hypothetical protein